MARLLALALCFLASASALVASPLARPAAAVSARAASPLMRDVIRVQIDIEQGEPLEKALRRFRKASNMCGHLRILKNRKTKEASMRLARARRSARNQRF